MAEVELLGAMRSSTLMVDLLAVMEVKVAIFGSLLIPMKQH